MAMESRIVPFRKSSVSPPSNTVDSTSPTVLDIWLFLNIFPSHFALLLLIATLLASKARRNVTLTNMCITWIIVGVVSSLLLYAGKQTGPEPSPMLCVAQAALIYAVPPLVSTSVLALVFQVWIQIVWRRGESAPAAILLPALILPYIVYVAFALAGATIGANNPELVNRDRRFFYCSINFSPFSDTIAMFAAIVLLITVALIVWLGVVLVRNWKAIQPEKNRGMVEDDKGIGADDLQLVIRVMIFGFYIFVGMILSILSINAPKSVVPDMVMASMGSAVVLVFGTQPALWTVCRNLLRREKQ